MKVTFLGTGTSQGVPVIGCKCEVCSSLDFRDNRLRASIHVLVDDLSLVIDTGPDFRQQMLRARIDRVDGILYTHGHKDHTAGMDDIRSYNFMQRMDMPLYGQKQVFDQLKQEFSYVFAKDKYPGIPQVEVHEIGLDPFKIRDTEIIPFEVLHYKLPVLGFRIKNFTYITDAKFIEESERKKIRNSEILVVNALQRESHISHFTLHEALAIIDDLSPKKAYLTHLSHRMGLHRDVLKELPDHVEIAYDGLTVEL